MSMIIPVRVPGDAKPVLASDRQMLIQPGHPLYEAGWTTGGAVAVHADCAGMTGSPS